VIVERFLEAAQGAYCRVFQSFCFRVNDKETTKYIQGRHGKGRKMETCMSAVAGRGIDEKICGVHVVEDWASHGLRWGK